MQSRVGDVDLRRLRERAIEYRKVMEDLFRLAKKEFEQDGNYGKFKEIELQYYQAVANFDMIDLQTGKFWKCLNFPKQLLCFADKRVWEN